MSDSSNKPLPLGFSSGEQSDVLSQRVISQFVGKHIAIVHKTVIASADSYEAIVEEAHRLFPNETPYIAFISGTSESGIVKADQTDLVPADE